MGLKNESLRFMRDKQNRERTMMKKLVVFGAIFTMIVMFLNGATAQAKRPVLRTQAVTAVTPVVAPAPVVTTSASTSASSIRSVVHKAVPKIKVQKPVIDTALTITAVEPVTFTDASGYCVTTDAASVPAGVQLGCHYDPKPFYFRDAQGYCGTTGQGEAKFAGLIYDPTCVK